MNYGNQATAMTVPQPEESIPTLGEAIFKMACELNEGLRNSKTALTGDCDPPEAATPRALNSVSGQLQAIRAELAEAIYHKNRICKGLSI